MHDLAFEWIRFTGSPGNDDRGTMLVVDGDRIAFRHTEMTWRRGICLNAGHRDGYSAAADPGTVLAEGLVIEDSAIHDCGNDPAIVESLRAQGQSGVHGIYLVYAKGAVIRDNYVYDNVSRGLQLWPDVDDTVVEHNVFDANGSNINVGSSAAYGLYSEGNRFANNVITDAVLRSVHDQPWGPGDVASIVGYFPADGSSHGNEFIDNCIDQPDPSLAYAGNGFTHSGDAFADPGYLDAARHDYRLRAGSPCAGAGPRGEGPLAITPQGPSQSAPAPPNQGGGAPGAGGPGDGPPPASPKGSGRCAGARARRWLRFERRPRVARRGGSLRLSLRAARRGRARIVLRRVGVQHGRPARRRRLALHVGENPVSLALPERTRAGRYLLRVAAVDVAGEPLRLGAPVRVR